jgi:hypothetical protein
MNDEFTDRLSAYMDGELDADDRADLERHLIGCGDCRRVLGELREVVETARLLTDREPVVDLWPAIARATDPEGTAEVVPISTAAARSRRFTFSVPQLAAAAIALMLLSGGAVWMVSHSAAAPDGAAIATATDTPPTVRFASAQAGYESAILALENAVNETRDRLSPETVRVLERNLAIIDAAIAEAREALSRDTASLYLNRHLDETMMAKIDILRRAADLGGAPI